MTPRSSTCLRCGNDQMVAYAHWLICPKCDPEFVAEITVRWAPVLELKDKGLPSKPGG